jgi:pimeloyl-ACP methyl ester carboxylesterase
VLALSYVIKYPAKLKKLVLIGGVAGGEFISQAKFNLLARGTTERKKLLRNYG